jgi:hypothetical protein
MRVAACFGAVAGVSVIALFVAGVRARFVAGERAIRFAAIAAGHIAVVARFGAFDHSVATPCGSARGGGRGGIAAAASRNGRHCDKPSQRKK